MSYIDKQFDLAAALDKLPANIHQVVAQIDIVSEIWSICAKFKLLISETGDTLEETKKVIIGETRPENFIDEIRNKLGDENKSKAVEIGTEINNKILIPIRDAYKKMSMGNIVPNPNEPAKISSEQNLGGKAPSTSSRQFSKKYSEQEATPEITFHQPFDRDFLMHEIENPTPAGVSMMPYDQETTNNELGMKNKYGTGQAPNNLPTEIKPEREVPVIRTMPRDMQSLTNNRKESVENQQSSITDSGKLSALTRSNFSESNLSGRGKFGQGIPPIIRQNRQNESSEITGRTFEEQKLSGQASSKLPSDNAQNAQIPKNIETQKPESIGSKTDYPSFIPREPVTTRTNLLIPNLNGQTGGTIRGDYRPATSNQKQKNNAEQMSPRTNFAPENLGDQALQTETEIKPAPLTPKSESEMAQPRLIMPDVNEQVIPITPKAPPEPRMTFTPPQKTKEIEDVVDDKLTKTVNVPSERKRYVVDPYREPIDE